MFGLVLDQFRNKKPMAFDMPNETQTHPAFHKSFGVRAAALRKISGRR